MPFIKKDDYTLAQSDNAELSDYEEKQINLKLKKNCCLNKGTIFGTVSDQLGNALPNASVVITDISNEAVGHTTTGQDGTYFFTGLEEGVEYKAYACAPGFGLTESLPFKAAVYQETERSFKLQYNPVSFLSCLEGFVKNELGHPISNAVIKLFEQNKNSEVLHAYSTTNHDGQYMITELPMGSYSVKVNAGGHQPHQEIIQINSQGKVFSHSFTLNSDTSEQNGIISGIITDENNSPISGADVILYIMEKDGTHKPVCHTKTLNNGFYLFINLAEGEYLIKSNRTLRLDDKIK